MTSDWNAELWCCCASSAPAATSQEMSQVELLVRAERANEILIMIIFRPVVFLNTFKWFHSSVKMRFYFWIFHIFEQWFSTSGPGPTGGPRRFCKLAIETFAGQFYWNDVNQYILYWLHSKWLHPWQKLQYDNLFESPFFGGGGVVVELDLKDFQFSIDPELRVWDTG